MKPLPAASNGISMNLQAGRSGGADSPAIRAEDPLYPNTTSPRPVCYYRFTLSGWNAARLKGGGEGAAEKRGGYSNLDLRTLTFGCSSTVSVGGWGGDKIAAL